MWLEAQQREHDDPRPYRADRVKRCEQRERAVNEYQLAQRTKDQAQVIRDDCNNPKVIEQLRGSLGYGILGLAFDDNLGAYYPDSLFPDRFILLGFSRVRRLLYVVYAEVEAETIRIISARRATKQERQDYGENPIP